MTVTTHPAAAPASAADREAAPVFDNSAGLTEREYEIVRLVATGMSNVEIAGTIYVSVNTIKSYIRTAYRKMKVQTRPQAVVWAFDHRLVVPASGRTAHASRDAASPGDAAA